MSARLSARETTAMSPHIPDRSRPPEAGRPRCSRRAAIAAVPATQAAGRRAAAGTPHGEQPTYTGDCRDDPGMDLLGRFDLGEPVLPMPALLPPPDWRISSNPRTGLTFLYPPDWLAGTLWAESLDASGTPAWTATQPFIPALTSHRIMSADGSALFEAVIGTLPNLLLAPLEAAAIAELGILGAGETAAICAFESRDSLTPGWLRGVRAGGRGQITFASQGYALPNASALVPGTIVTWYAMAGPSGLFEALMRQVFLRILFQFMGGGDEPTPTPEGW